MIDKYASRKQSQDTDNIQTISYFVKNSETTFQTPPYMLYRVIRSAKTITIDAGGRALLKQVIVFRIYRSDMDNAGMTVFPKIKDKIVTADGVVYILIEKVQPINRFQEFVCYCQESTNV